jgi:DNA-binding CsgD family transcriptional regulator
MATVTNRYTVTAKRWARGWELHIEGVGVTQTTTLSKAEAIAREYIAFTLDVDDENAFAVDIVPQLDATLAEQVRAARDQVKDAERKQREAAAKQREVAKKLGRSGLSGREIAAVLGLTPQRVSQLIGTSPNRAVAKVDRAGGQLVSRSAASKAGRTTHRAKPVAGRKPAGHSK